ncbi:VWA domain-containing protein [Actinopolymorpha sp. B11F2]|uniref:VWA domain-containing protein n=1 Tax=Actinopolymorpha sp. B11F2 TaxID=3160862 RepID=UPI0032E44FD8
MNGGSGFTLTISQNKFLAHGAREVNAIVTIESTGLGGLLGGEEPDTGMAEVIILDTSASMEWPITKIMAARQAAMKAVDNLRDGVSFAVVAGNHVATMVYPREEQTVEANRRTKIEAKAAIGGLAPSGGTAMGAWLQLAAQLFAPHREDLRHAILLTDGKNEHEAPEQFGATLSAVAGSFVCDCRGVGTDWEPDELRRVSSALLGSVDIVPDPNDLEADFRAMTEHAMGKSIGDVALRIWRPEASRLKFVRQVLPSVEDLTERGVKAGRMAYDFPTGSWGNEVRDYHICIEVMSGAVGQEMRAAWVRLVQPGDPPEVLASGNVLASWTDEEGDYTMIDPQVAHYTGQQELAEVIQAGLHAKRSGDLDTATTRLGRAVTLARQTGNEATSALLDKVVDVIDHESGTVRLKSVVDKVDEMSLDTRSTRTVRTRKE